MNRTNIYHPQNETTVLNFTVYLFVLSLPFDDLPVDEIAVLINSVKDSALITSDTVKAIIENAVDILQAVVKLNRIFKNQKEVF